MPLAFDELNTLGTERPVRKQSTPRNRFIPYNEFFGEMYLDEDEKERRIAMAEALDDVFEFMFAALALFTDVGEITYPVIYEMAERRYRDAIEPFLTALALESMDIESTIANQVRIIVDTTIENIGDAYYTSTDRAKFIAENQANVIGNAMAEEEAIAAGFTHKVWVSMRDLHVRPSHKEADGQIVPIMQPFSVGDALMMHPCDDSLGAGAEEIVNCRCVVEYTNAPKAEQRFGSVRMNLQIFAEKALAKQSAVQLRKGIASLQKRTEEHLEHINNPQNYVDGWDNLDENIRQGLVRHWEKEIQTFQTGIQDRINELSSRGEAIE